jgi:rRNA processing protein Krr1/Pno1
MRKGFRGVPDEDRHAKDDYDDYDDDDADDHDYEYGRKAGHKEKETALVVNVEKRHHGLLIGERGATVKKMNQTYNCEVVIPDRRDPSTEVVIHGYVSNARECKEHILTLIGQKTVEAPRSRTGVLSNTASNATAFPALPNQEETIIELSLNKAQHGNLIGTNHERKEELLKNLRGGAKRIPGIDIRIPKKEDPSNIISIHVPAYYVDEAKRIIREFLERYDLIAATNRTELKVVSMTSQSAGKTSGAPPPPPAQAEKTTTSLTSAVSRTPTTTTTAATRGPPADRKAPSAPYVLHEEYYDLSSLRIQSAASAHGPTDPGVNNYDHAVKPKRVQ